MSGANNGLVEVGELHFAVFCDCGEEPRELTRVGAKTPEKLAKLVRRHAKRQEAWACPGCGEAYRFTGEVPLAVEAIGLEEWECHVSDTRADHAGKAICGERLSPSSFAFTGLDHWLNTVRFGSRLDACPRCKSAVADALSAGL